ncbi:hypothetical protein TWF730_001668 [Orbilia blumenaviensis]|uniref:F-box domain-containing protein n=1 Tax=Orbilia blumenaviensis TaxID=1796055 RepID=A0AAV9UIK8_9PEZI
MFTGETIDTAAEYPPPSGSKSQDPVGPDTRQHVNILPPEIWYHIFKSFLNRSRRALAALAQTCTFFRDIAIPLLYREFSLPYGDGVFGPRHYAALTSPTNLGLKFIKDVRFLGDNWMTKDLTGRPVKEVMEQRERGYEDVFSLIKPDQLSRIRFYGKYRHLPISPATIFEFIRSQSQLECISIRVEDFVTSEDLFHLVPSLQRLKKISIALYILPAASRTWPLEYFANSWIWPSSETLEHLRLEDKKDNDYPEQEYLDEKDLKWTNIIFPKPTNEAGETERPLLPNLKTFEISSNVAAMRYLPIMHRLFDYDKLTTFAFEGYEDIKPDVLIYLAEAVSKFKNLKTLRLVNTWHQETGQVIESAPPIHKLICDQFWFTDQTIQYQYFIPHKQYLRHLRLFNKQAIVLKSLNEDFAIWSWPCLETLVVSCDDRSNWGYHRPPMSAEVLKLPESLKALHLLYTKGRIFKIHEESSPPKPPWQADEPSRVVSRMWVTFWREQLLEAVPTFEFPTIEVVPVSGLDRVGEDDLNPSTRLARRPQLRLLQVGDRRRNKYHPFNFEAVYGGDNRISRWKGTSFNDIVMKNPDLEGLEDMHGSWIPWTPPIEIWGKWW